MLEVCLVVDVENFISFKQGNPRWNSWEKIKGKINNLIKNFRYNKKGFYLAYNTIVNERFPTTFMLVGSLFKPLVKHKFIEWGYHTLNHIPLTLANNEILKKETENIYKVKSFSPPLWMVEDISNPDRVFKILEKKKYKYIIYRGIDKGIEHEHHFAIEKPIKRGKLKLIHVSNWVEGNSKLEHVKRVLREIEENANKEAVYCITSHDFSHKNNKNLIFLINELRKLEKEKKIKVIKISEIRS